MLDPFTFSNTKAAQVLVNKLNTIGDTVLIRRISALLNAYNKGMRAVSVVEDKRTREGIWHLIETHYVNRVLESHSLHDLNSYVLNVIKTQYKQWMRFSFQIGSWKEKNKKWWLE